MANATTFSVSKTPLSLGKSGWSKRRSTSSSNDTLPYSSSFFLVLFCAISAFDITFSATHSLDRPPPARAKNTTPLAPRPTAETTVMSSKLSDRSDVLSPSPMVRVNRKWPGEVFFFFRLRFRFGFTVLERFYRARVIGGCILLLPLFLLAVQDFLGLNGSFLIVELLDPWHVYKTTSLLTCYYEERAKLRNVTKTRLDSRFLFGISFFKSHVHRSYKHSHY